MTIDNISENDPATSEFANELVDAINSNLDFVNGIQFGEITGATDGNALLSITFVSAYSSAPAIFAWRESTVSSSPRTCHLDTVSTTGATFRLFGGTAPQTSSSGNTVRWMAIGTLA